MRNARLYQADPGYKTGYASKVAATIEVHKYIMGIEAMTRDLPEQDVFEHRNKLRQSIVEDLYRRSPKIMSLPQIIDSRKQFKTVVINKC